MTTKPLAHAAYQKLADAYARHVDTKPHNAYYERPAMLSMLPEVSGAKVLDAGCGPAAYAQQLAARGANVVACDMSERMLERAVERIDAAILAGKVESGQVVFQQLDLTKPLVMFEDAIFDLVNAPLCLDYIEDWTSLFLEFFRVLKPGGTLLFSSGHPASEAEYYRTKDYFSIEPVTAVWTGFGIKVTMPSYRRSMEEVFNPVADAGLILERVHEPQPTEDFKRADLRRYKQLLHRPVFVCVRAKKPI